MSPHATAYARWFEHAGGVNPPSQLHHWLVDTTSLTKKLTACCSEFRVCCLQQQRSVCLADEFSAVALSRRGCVREREVLLQCDGRPVVYAHTIVPLQATASDWPFFSALGERSLGTTLFNDPQVRRGALQFARLRAQHPLARRAYAAVGRGQVNFPIFARRCLYWRRKGVLLVTELFLPAVTGLKSANATHYIQRPRSGAIPAPAN